MEALVPDFNAAHQAGVSKRCCIVKLFYCSLSLPLYNSKVPAD